MSNTIPNLPDFPSNDHLNYQELYSIALDLLRDSKPRVSLDVSQEGLAIGSIEQIEELNPPFNVRVNFRESLKPSSDLFQALRGAFESRFTSIDDMDLIGEQLSSAEKMNEFVTNFDYQTLTMQVTDFITQVIREWQTGSKTRKMIKGSLEALSNLRVAAINTSRFTDEDGENDYFDPNRIDDYMRSENPYLNENNFDELYAPTPEESPEGITMLHINGLVGASLQYIFGYVVPRQIIKAKYPWGEEKYNDINFSIANEFLFKIIVAYLVAGVPVIDFEESDYLM